MHYCLIFINSRSSKWALRLGPFLDFKQGNDFNKGERRISHQETDQKRDGMFRRKDEENCHEDNVNKYFHSHGTQVPSRKFAGILSTCPDQVNMYRECNGKKEKWDQGKKREIRCRDQEKEHPIAGSGKHKGQQEQVEGVFSE